jgi:uncharacterized protein
VIDAGYVDLALAGAWMRESPLHGEEHWRCVAASGLALAGSDPRVDRELVLYFGLLHDTRRENESYDPGHGPRAAAYARELGLPLEAERLALLCGAIERHSDGLVSDEPTTAVCWDADRVPLPRVGIDPRQDLFSTGHARGHEPLAAAALLREAPPTWRELLDLAW